jgi:hypothetical protein
VAEDDNAVELGAEYGGGAELLLLTVVVTVTGGSELEDVDTFDDEGDVLDDFEYAGGGLL